MKKLITLLALASIVSVFLVGCKPAEPEAEAAPATTTTVPDGDKATMETAPAADAAATPAADAAPAEGTAPAEGAAPAEGGK